MTPLKNQGINGLGPIRRITQTKSWITESNTIRLRLLLSEPQSLLRVYHIHRQIPHALRYAVVVAPSSLHREKKRKKL